MSFFPISSRLARVTLAAGVVMICAAASADGQTTCAVTLDKASLAVGAGEADWTINVTAAAACAWSATSDSDWLVAKSTMPSPAAGNGYAKVRAVPNTTSPAKRLGHFAVNGVSYAVTQGGCGTNCTTPPPPPPSTTLRVMQYNTHHGGWGSDGVWDPTRIVDWIVTANPDVVSMNEIEVGTNWSKGGNDPTIYQTLLQQRTGVTWYQLFLTASGQPTGNGNLLLSKLPFVTTATRLLHDVRCAVDVTVVVNGRNISVTSVHLDDVAASNRIAEIGDLLAFETGFADPRLVLGDMNAWPGTNEMTDLLDGGYIDTWTAAQTLGTAIGNGITHGSHRIDYILLSTGGANTLTLVSQQIFHTADPVTGVTPSDHEPVLAIFNVK